MTMVVVQDLIEIAERCEKATGPSRVVDFEIQIAVFGDAIWPATDMQGRITNPNSRMSDYLAIYRDVIDEDDQDFNFPRYTGSIDAAMTLMPEGWDWHLDGKGAAALCSCFNDDYAPVFSSGPRPARKIPALALCAASLRARASLKGEG